MRHCVITLILIACLGCSREPQQSLRVVTEQDARLISIARESAVANGFSLKDAVYQVRPDANGWIVQIDYAPGYRGSGEPRAVVDGTLFVKMGRDEKVSEILSSGRWIRP